MRKILSIGIVFILLMTMPVLANKDEVSLNNKGEMPASWAVAEIEEAKLQGLIPSSLQSDYAKPITRKEFCILAITMIESKYDMPIEQFLENKGLSMAPEDTFSDIAIKEVLAAKSLGITDGVSQNLFGPDLPLTREQAAKFLTSTAQACGESIESKTPQYTDANDIANWAKSYTGYVYDAGIMQGVGGNRFDPKGSYQRQQAL